MDDTVSQPEQAKPLSRRKLRRRCFELVFELAQRPSATISELLTRSFENRLTPRKGDEQDDEMLFLAGDAEDGIIVGEVDESGRAFVTELCTSVSENWTMLDRVLSRYPHEWQFERMGMPEQAVLRMALAELLFMSTPHRIVINEALELAKLYGEADAHRFINGILGAVKRDLEKIQEEHHLG